MINRTPFSLSKYFFIAICAMLFSINSFAQTTLTVGDYKIEEVWIKMKDGTKLATDIYINTKLDKGEKMPVILEYIPYRKDEGRASRLSVYSYFLDRGYIFARVDIRGSGRSEGKLVQGEYSEQEQLDGEVIIDWLSKRPYCNGSVAMF